MITPLLLQEPPPSDPFGRSQIVWGGPPETSIFLSLSCDANARKRPSEDQNTLVAPSVPGKGRASRESRLRTHTSTRPSAPAAVKASLLPSGERSKLTGSKPPFSGGGIWKRTAARSGGVSRK